MFKIKRFFKGQYITLLNSPCDKLYIIKEGSVEVQTYQKIKIARKGEILGLIAFFASQNHIDTSIALEDILAFELSYKDIDNITSKYHMIANILNELSNHLSNAFYTISSIINSLEENSERSIKEQLFFASKLFV